MRMTVLVPEDLGITQPWQYQFKRIWRISQPWQWHWDPEDCWMWSQGSEMPHDRRNRSYIKVVTAAKNISNHNNNDGCHGNKKQTKFPGEGPEQNSKNRLQLKDDGVSSGRLTKIGCWMLTETTTRKAQVLEKSREISGIKNKGSQVS